MAITVGDTDCTTGLSGTLLDELRASGSFADPGDMPDPTAGEAAQKAMAYAVAKAVAEAHNADGGGAGATAYTGISADYTATTADDVVAVTSLAANRTVTLPSAATAGAGKRLTVKDATGAAATGKFIKIAANGSDTIDGAAAILLFDDYGHVQLASNGTNGWAIVEGIEHCGIDPRTITGLKAWFDANRDVTRSGATTDVTGWADLSGNGNNLVAAATAPTLAYANTSKGRRVVAFGGSHSLKTSGNCQFSTGVTVLAVVSCSDWGGTAWRGMVAQSAGTSGTYPNGWNVKRSGSTASAFSNSLNAGGTASGAYSSVRMTTLSMQLFAVRVGGASPVPTFRLNAADVPGATTTTTAFSGTTSALPMYVGETHFDNAGADFWLGDIGELLVFDALVSDANLQMVEQYLKRRWLL